jgi:hypothetical protein
LQVSGCSLEICRAVYFPCSSSTPVDMSLTTSSSFQIRPRPSTSASLSFRYNLLLASFYPTFQRQQVGQPCLATPGSCRGDQYSHSRSGIHRVSKSWNRDLS